MSSEGYAGYRPSQAERARLERERQRQLEEERRRQEEEARREEQRLRQGMVAAQKKRVEWAADFRAGPRGLDSEFERTPPQARRGATRREVPTQDSRGSEREAAERELRPLKARLEAFPGEWRTAYKRQLASLYQLVQLAEKERRTNLTYHNESLRRGEQELLNLAASSTDALHLPGPRERP